MASMSDPSTPIWEKIFPAHSKRLKVLGQEASEMERRSAQVGASSTRTEAVTWEKRWAEGPFFTAVSDLAEVLM